MKDCCMESGCGPDEHEGWLQCQDCDRRKPDVRERKCPYEDDVNNRLVMCTVCDDCEHARAMEI